MPLLDEALLDDETALTQIDTRRSVRALATAGAQVREAIHLCAEAGLPRLSGGDRPRSVLVAALGGWAVVADVLGLLAEPGSPVPVSTRQGMPLPGWVGSLDLVVAVSHSGRAPGPLALAAEAARRGAALLTVGAPDSPLADVCARARGIHVDVPVERTSTRTAMWSLLAPVVYAADALGLVRAGPQVLAKVADRLDGWAEALRPSSECFVNPAKSLAIDLAAGIPVVLGDQPAVLTHRTGVAAAQLDSVVLSGVVAGREHRSRAIEGPAGVVQLVGRGQPDEGDVDPVGGDPLGERPGQLRGARSHVVPHDHARGGIRADHNVGERRADGSRHVVIELLGDQAANVVGLDEVAEVATGGVHDRQA